MKDVLIISSSPRIGGNSDTLCNEFARGCAEVGNSVDKISVANKKIGYCTACYACKETSQCILADDMEGILDKMVSADIIVLATPVYFYTMCAQMKTVIDRTLPRHTEIANKDFYFIVTMADSDKQAMERTLEGLRGFSAECLYGAKEQGVIYGSGIWQLGDVLRSGAMKQAYEMGK
ncbi:MAG: flavodoxin family protein, partial [Deltaproteobacteria bacterium]|nr:flavodoxin family protein [Deltaproteobacteria bacterium]